MATDAPAAVPASVAAQTAPKVKSRGGRPRASSRPKIDIDHEIIEANRLAEVTRRMMQAAKAAQRNSRRSKQRLVRKAGKLSAEDLERIAVLKRCGLYAEQEDSSTTTAGSSSASGSASCASSPASNPSPVNLKLASAVGKISGAAEILSSVQGSLSSVVPSPPSSVAADGQSASSARAARPRGKLLMRAASSCALGASQAPLPEVHEDSEQLPDAEQDVTEDADEEM